MLQLGLYTHTPSFVQFQGGHVQTFTELIWNYPHVRILFMCYKSTSVRFYVYIFLMQL